MIYLNYLWHDNDTDTTVTVLSYNATVKKTAKAKVGAYNAMDVYLLWGL